MPEITVRFEWTAKTVAKIILFVIWLVILVLLASFTHGALVVDRVYRAFQVGLAATIIWFVIGVLCFAYKQTLGKLIRK